MSSSVIPTPTAGPTPTQTPASGGGGPQSSPLLFFVALGFGVVFTNLWIIVGVKYCFRYNARNRQPRQDENGDPIDLATLPRAHRRRREKKLMTMDEVNERFPLIKYKAWMTSRAEEGLSTAGGVAAPQSRAASINNAEGVIPKPHDPKASETTSTHNAPTSSAPTDPQTEKPSSDHPSTTDPNAPQNPANPISSPSHNPSDPDPDHDHDSDSETDQIHPALPLTALPSPGDSCAICIDTLEDSDDVRGLTCGHAFHASCLDPWLTSRRACCPLCKADYYVPKPRPDGGAIDPATGAGAPGDAAGASGGLAALGLTGRRAQGGSAAGGRIDGVVAPPFAFLGRGAHALRPRTMFPGRAPGHSANASVAATGGLEEGNERFGFPTQQRGVRFGRRRGGRGLAQGGAVGVGDEGTGEGGRGWRERVRGVRMPRWGRRGGSAGGNGNAEVGGGASEGISGGVGTTPAQLEEGRTAG